MGPEKVGHHQSEINKERIGQVRDWSEMKSYLPDLDPNDRKFVEIYFRVQVLSVLDKKIKARRLSYLLTRFTGFPQFEDSNEPIMAAVEMAVRGRSRADVTPALVFRNSSKP